MGTSKGSPWYKGEQRGSDAAVLAWDNTYQATVKTCAKTGREAGKNKYSNMSQSSMGEGKSITSP